MHKSDRRIHPRFTVSGVNEDPNGNLKQICQCVKPIKISKDLKILEGTSGGVMVSKLD